MFLFPVGATADDEFGIKALCRELNTISKERWPNSEQLLQITPRVLTFWAYGTKERYVSFSIPKKTGGVRQIRSPKYGLKTIQRLLADWMYMHYEPKPYVTGFVPGKSIVDNARIHSAKRFLYNVDIKDFFPSIGLHRLAKVLQLKPFELDQRLAYVIANLCCEDGSLPQGAPTSPICSNLVSQKLDWRLQSFCKKHKVRYSRFADDMSFSSNENSFSKDFRSQLHKIIESEGFMLHPDKMRLQKSNKRQVVTGLTVNERPNLNKKWLKQFRYELFVWQKHGLISAMMVTLSNQSRPAMESYKQFIGIMFGKLGHIKNVRGEKDSSYQQLVQAVKENMSKSEQNWKTADSYSYTTKNAIAEISSQKSDQPFIEVIPHFSHTILAIWATEGFEGVENWLKNNSNFDLH